MMSRPGRVLHADGSVSRSMTESRLRAYLESIAYLRPVIMPVAIIRLKEMRR